MSKLIFIDWDDTLFPTSWILDSNINIENPEEPIISMFQALDSIISSLIIELNDNTNTRILIVTNATNEWIDKCLQFLPFFKMSIIDEGITSITSARYLYQKDENDLTTQWKHHAFDMLCRENESRHIVSLGDGESEHLAVQNLKNDQRIIGSIRFHKNPTLNQLMSQLSIVNECGFMESNDDYTIHLTEFL